MIRDLKELKLVVEEANELTLELRGLLNLSFKGRLLMDPDSKEDGLGSADSKCFQMLSGACSCGLLEEAGAWRRESCILGREARNSIAKGVQVCLRSQLIATWTLTDFQHRLEVDSNALWTRVVAAKRP